MPSQETISDGTTLSMSPVADPRSTVTGPNYRFTLMDEVVLRYEWSLDGVFEDRASTLAIHRSFPPTQFSVQDTKANLEIVTPNFHVVYDKKRFSQSGLHVTFSSKTTLWGSEWRFGQDAIDKNLGGTARTLDECDGRCEMGAGILSRSGYAALDDSESMLFDGMGFVSPRRPGDRIDGYLFCYGLDYKRAMRSYFAISGRQPRLPRWALGNWWSRFHRYSADSYVALMDKFRAQDIPLSVAVIDMDWHLVHDVRVPHAGWTGYTWNETLFPNPTDFGRALHDRNLRITLNDHPHSGLHHHEALYEEMAKALNHDTSDRAPIAFDPTNKRLLDAWLTILHRSLERQACDFWWIDWQQGSTSRVPGLDPLWLLNHFHFLDNANKVGGSPLIFSRYAGPGSHRYPVGFSGDSFATWASLQFQPEFTATASNIGYGWWSHDIGGHMHGYRDDELTTRWVQFGAFSPILRLHSSDSQWASKEPCLYREEYAKVMTSALQLRHRLVPYIFTMNVVGAVSDEPLIQPMYWKYPARDEAYEFPNQYSFGTALVVAPVVTACSKVTGLASVKVWIPPQRHVDIFTGWVYDGDREISMHRSISNIPVLAAQGSIIPLDLTLAPSNGCFNPEGYEVYIVVGQNGHFVIIEDPRDDVDNPQKLDGPDRQIKIEFDQLAGRVKVESGGKWWKFRFVAVSRVPYGVRVLFNGAKQADATFNLEDTTGPPGLVVEVPPQPVDGTIIVDLGLNPQLDCIDPVETISNMLLDWQIDFALKEKLWKIVTSGQNESIKLGRLLTLGIEKALIGPIVEVLCSDSRTATGDTAFESIVAEEV
ncbi:glycoside hydrolase family 31 protein [Myriangium duriaei CBS 260.36]|uniref:alpha-glucosidase n=1 Tax=Myriangium duriaei CBS 260.36 TaxID=1168546 RepID=A0A9P4IYF3_9PEZI|nr:glycoside hydrolase family 31 protein [Myriangium duriaei CBS 260.36]